MPHGVECPFGQAGPAVLAVSPPAPGVPSAPCQTFLNLYYFHKDLKLYVCLWKCAYRLQMCTQVTCLDKEGTMENE